MDNESATTVHLYGYVRKLSLLSAKGSLTLLFAVTGNGLTQALIAGFIGQKELPSQPRTGKLRALGVTLGISCFQPCLLPGVRVTILLPHRHKFLHRCQ